jgi:type I restriction enzyme S subunit
MNHCEYNLKFYNERPKMSYDLIEKYFLHKYPGDGPHKGIREELINSCIDFVKSGLADSNFINELCSGSENIFWSRVSEALLSTHLKKVGLIPESSQRGGPDFYVIDSGRKVWIEVICPEPKGLPTEWTEAELGKVISTPCDQILLRWTSAIKEKSEKLLGSLDGEVKGYIEKGIVSIDDAYVIAVNGYKLRSKNPPSPELYGISQFPFAVEAVFAVGSYQITIDRDTLKQTGDGHQQRLLIPKHKRKSVPADTFLDARFQPISAVWAVDIDGSSAIGNPESMAVVHNPNADNPISTSFLPAYVLETAQRFRLNCINRKSRTANRRDFANSKTA